MTDERSKMAANGKTFTALAKRISELEAENTDLRAKVRLLDSVTDSTGLLTMQQTAKALGTGPTRLFDFLREQRIFTKENVPLQTHIEAGRFTVRTGYYRRPDGERQVYTRAYATSKGLAFIGERLAKPDAGERESAA